jgi:hypothetical protein
MKLRQWIIAGLIVLGFSAGAARGQTGGDAADGVRAADAAWLKVYSARDLDKPVAFCDEPGSMLAPNAPIATGNAAIAKVIASNFPYGDLLWHADSARRLPVG